MTYRSSAFSPAASRADYAKETGTRERHRTVTNEAFTPGFGNVYFRNDRFDPIESEFATNEDAAAYDAWFRAKVERAMASTAPKIPHDQVMAEMRAIIERAKAR